MDAQLGSEQDGIDWRQVRRPWTEPPLYSRTFDWLNFLPGQLRPTELCRHYPRIANDLCALWELPKMWEDYISDLLALDTRTPLRRGFAHNIVNELVRLHRHRSSKHS
jgi:hypothetical protein